MFERCLFCRSRFLPNQLLAHFPLARQIAYDPARGRLWIICRRCGRWCLVPIESRWEAVQELESIFEKVGLAAKSDGLALVAHDGLRVLRVGRGGSREEAWWRYGRQFRTRRLVRGPIVVAGIFAATTMAAVAGGAGGAGVIVGYGGAMLWPAAIELIRAFGFGGVAWRGRMKCRKCDATRETIPFREFRRLELVPGARTGEVALRVPCLGCDRWSLRLERLEAQHVMQRALAYHHFFGAPTRRVQEAFDLIEKAGSAQDFLVNVARERRRLREFAQAELVAVEVAISDAVEAQRAGMSLDEHRAAWVQEEELARIIDHELTPT